MSKRKPHLAEAEDAPTPQAPEPPEPEPELEFERDLLRHPYNEGELKQRDYERRHPTPRLGLE